MPLRVSAASNHERTWTGHVDARWTMAYAAGLRRADADYFDTTCPRGIVAHPMFHVCAEWQVLTDPAEQPNDRDLGLTPEEAARGVHASHDVVIQAPILPGQDITVRGSIVGVEATTAGVLLTYRFDGMGEDGPLWTTWMGNVYRGVDVEGDEFFPADQPTAPPRPTLDAAVVASDQLALAAGEAHIYTECARIWNPIHTDLAVARAVDLPGLILHGTANLAHGVSFAMDVLSADAASVRRVGGSFRAMVTLPSTVERRVRQIDDLPDGSKVAHFEVLTEHGQTAVKDGFVIVGQLGTNDAFLGTSNIDKSRAGGGYAFGLVKPSAVTLTGGRSRPLRARCGKPVAAK